MRFPGHETVPIGNRVRVNAALGPVQTSNFTCAESNANEKNLLFSLICIRFGTCKVRRLNRALSSLIGSLRNEDGDGNENATKQWA